LNAWNAASRRSRERLGDGERLAEEALKPRRPLYDRSIRGAQFFDAEQRNDVLQFLEAGERFADAFRQLVVLIADDDGIEQGRRRSQGSMAG